MSAAERLTLIPARSIPFQAPTTGTTVVHRNALSYVRLSRYHRLGSRSEDAKRIGVSGHSSAAVLHQIGTAREPPQTRVHRGDTYRPRH